MYISGNKHHTFKMSLLLQSQLQVCLIYTFLELIPGTEVFLITLFKNLATGDTDSLDVCG